MDKHAHLSTYRILARSQSKSLHICMYRQTYISVYIPYTIYISVYIPYTTRNTSKQLKQHIKTIHIYMYRQTHISVYIPYTTRNTSKQLKQHTKTTHIYMYTSKDRYAHLSTYGVATVSRIDKNHRSLLQKRPIKETIFCKRDL